MNPETQTPPIVAEQQSYKVGDYVLPALAFDEKGGITITSLVDLMMICLALMDNPKVNEVLKANEVIIRDLEGKLVFPRPR